jgi:hypothetical protein
MIFCLKHPARVMTVLCRKLSVTLFMVFFAVLATASPTMDPGIEALQKKVGFTVIERFSTPVGGVTGYVVKTGDGKNGIIYGVGDYTFSGALQAFEENFGNNGSGEGISELTPVPANLKAALEQHSKWMAELGFSGTPGLLFKDTSGQWQGQTGVLGQEALGRALGIAE